MNWAALKNGDCPQCGKQLKSSGLGLGNIPALKCSCGFKISEKRLTEILQKKPRRNYNERSEEQNLSELNNFGHDDMSEGFEDSPHLDY